MNDRAARVGVDRPELTLMPAGRGLTWFGMAAAVAVPLVALLLTCELNGGFSDWQASVRVLTAVGFSCAIALLFRGFRARMLAQGVVEVYHDRLMLEVPSVVPGRQVLAREDARVEHGFEVLSERPRRRYSSTFELVSSTEHGPLRLDLGRWKSCSSLTGSERRSMAEAFPAGESGRSLAARLGWWVQTGSLDRQDARLLYARPPVLPKESSSRSPHEKRGGSLNSPAPGWLRWLFYSAGLVTPVVSWMWLQASVSEPLQFVRELGYFWLLLAFVLVLQPVIGRVLRTRGELLLATFGPLVSFGLVRLLAVPLGSPAASFGDWASQAVVDLGSLRVLTVFIAFAAVAYVAPFASGASKHWQSTDLRAFVVRAVLALLVLVPALMYCRVLVAEQLKVLGAEGWLFTLGWLGAVVSETLVVLRRMLAEAVL